MTVAGESADGESALAAFGASPDVVFLDIQMPALTAFDVIEILTKGEFPP